MPKQMAGSRSGSPRRFFSHISSLRLLSGGAVHLPEQLPRSFFVRGFVPIPNVFFKALFLGEFFELICDHLNT
jgi:hypothetical protein